MSDNQMMRQQTRELHSHSSELEKRQEEGINLSHLTSKVAKIITVVRHWQQGKQGSKNKTTIEG